MSRMIDRLLDTGCVCVDELSQRDIIHRLGRAVVFDITNVAEYVRDECGRGHRQWSQTEFPCLAPPYEDYWMEFAVRPCGDPAAARRAGALVLAEEYPVGNGSTPLVEGARWHTWALLLFELRDGRFFAGPGHEEYLDRSGVCMQRFIRRPAHWDSELCRQAVDEVFLPISLATTFLHCRNVVVEEKSPSIRRSRAHEERTGRPLVTFKTLQLEPVQRLLSEEGKREEVGLKVALHICRGHFKDYRERGLFGKRHGIYWWGQALRGHAEQGVVLKDYAVKGPARAAIG